MIKTLAHKLSKHIKKHKEHIEMLFKNDFYSGLKNDAERQQLHDDFEAALEKHMPADLLFEHNDVHDQMHRLFQNGGKFKDDQTLSIRYRNLIANPLYRKAKKDLKIEVMEAREKIIKARKEEA